MPKVDALKEELSLLRDEYKNYFLIMIALLSGEASLLYAVISGDKPLLVLYLGILGMVFLLLVIYKLKKLKETLVKTIKELQEA